MRIGLVGLGGTAATMSTDVTGYDQHPGDVASPAAPVATGRWQAGGHCAHTTPAPRAPISGDAPAGVRAEG